MHTTTKHGKIVRHTQERMSDGVDGRSENILHVTFARMNPVTSAHIELLSLMASEIAAGKNCEGAVVLSQTKDLKNPLTVCERTQLLADVGFNTPQFSIFSASDMFTAMDRMTSYAAMYGYTGIVWWIGSDRLNAALRLWLYPNRWNVPLLRIMELQREPGDKRSATAMRAAALNSDYKTFEQLAGVHKDSVRPLFETLRSRLTDGSLESKTKTAK